MPITAPIDGPPPSPETDPAAAREVGRPSAQVAQLTAGQGQTPGMPAGPDLSGVLVLGQKIVEGMLALAQAAPQIAPEMDQAQSIVMNALGKFSSEAASGPPARGQVVDQAGSQFPGAFSGNSRPY